MRTRLSANRPAKAALEPIWEFIYIAEALLGLLGTAQNFFVSFLQALAGFLP